MKFKQVNDQHVDILDDKGEKVGHIFSPSGSGEDTKNAIQVCGFSEAFDLWGCGVFQGFKDIQLLFDGKKMDGEPIDFHRDNIDEECTKCYMKPCQCEVSPNHVPFIVKSEGWLCERNRLIKKSKEVKPDNPDE